MSPKLRALCRYIAPFVQSSTHVRIIAAMADFEAFARLGEPMIGCGWRKGHEFAYPDGMSEGEWMRETRRIFRRSRPLSLVLAGDLIAAYALLKAVRR